MAKLAFSNIKISAMAAAVPSFTQSIDTSDPLNVKYIKQMGIKERHISITEQTSVDLGYVALQEALAKAKWAASDLDLVIFASQTPDYIGGTGNAMMIHKYMDLPDDCAAMDMPMGCPAFPYAVSTACSFLQQSHINKAAVLTGDSFWWEYPNKEALLSEKRFSFGEGCGVMLLEKVFPSDEANAAHSSDPLAAMHFELFAQGKSFPYIFYSNTGIKNTWRHMDHYILPNGEEFGSMQTGHKALYMDGLAMTYFAVKKMREHIEELYGDKVRTYDHYLFSQSNKQVIDMLTMGLQLEPEKVLTSLADYGNTSSAAVILTLCKNLEKLKPHAHVFNASVGIGLAWGYSDFFVEPEVVCPLLTTDLRLEEHFLRAL